MPFLAANQTDWAGVAALVAAVVALAGFLITALRGRRADDLDTIIKANAELRRDNDDLRHELGDIRKRVDELESTLVKCQRENGRMRRKLSV